MDDVRLRPIPYPYHAALAICSDLDETPDRHVYWEIASFLNTNKVTSMGPGVGLEVGNTIYFDMSPDQFAYWNTDDAGREMVRTLIRSGHVDCLHSYGDLATTRAHAARALDELDRHDCRLEVWVDHAVAPTNFGADIMNGHGDVPGAPAYHADLSCAFGVKYVWRGRITSVVGQGVPRSVGGIADRRNIVGSGRTVAKECVKGTLARLGNRKYAMHGPNEVLRRTRLRDGREVHEFMRANPYWGGVEHSATSAGLADVMTDRFLKRLVERGGVCILYTHLGKIKDHERPFGLPAQDALRRLAEYQQGGSILVTTTHRLLEFRRAVTEADWTVRYEDDGALSIDLRLDSLPDQRAAVSAIDGLTWYVGDSAAVRLIVNGRKIEDLRINPPDQTGRASVSVPWPRLEFPSL